jgi:hypothetical protein
MSDYAAAAEAALAAIESSNDPRSHTGFIGWNEGVFQRITMRGGAPIAQPMDATMLQVRLSEVVRYLGADGHQLQVPALGFAKYIGALPEVEDLPPINRVVDVPVFTEDGKLTRPGYNEGSGGVFYVPKFNISDVKSSARVARAALKFIKEELLGDFIWDGPADFAHALCIMIQRFVRDMIKSPTRSTRSTPRRRARARGCSRSVLRCRPLACCPRRPTRSRPRSGESGSRRCCLPGDRSS